ncbi:MAG: DUF1700 domain-containing protein [Clostridia bacterium]|nr:DUF1700 domain-containing protein [Clostridia bacterium]
MSKQEFLAQLRNGLSGLPQDDIEERLNFYNEMIDDRIEEGLSESEAVHAIGTVNDVVAQILADTPLTKLVKEKVKPNRGLKAWEIVLLVLGSPIWLSLLIAAFAVILAAYIVVWSAVVTLWSIEASLAACSLGGMVSAVVFALQGNGLTGLAMLSVGICCAGLSVFLFFGCKAATNGIVLLTKKTAFGMKTLFVGKETA